jgi:SAM-dependent methyltransferase
MTDHQQDQHDEGPQRQGSWLIDRPLTGLALPQGMRGRLIGWLMTRDTSEQRDVFEAMWLQPGQRVLEVGHGPGVLLALMADAGAEVIGVEPSPVMRDSARRRLREAIAAGQVDIRNGTAERTGLPDQSVDVAVAVNNVPMWSDLDAGFRELHRVLRPGGRLVVAWHGGRRPTRIGSRLILADDVLIHILTRMRTVFGDGEGRNLNHVVIFEATR